MRYLFSPAGLKVLEKFTRETSLIILDYDGTISPLVHVPSRARTPERSRRLLLDLCRQVPVAVVSGRGARDVRLRLGFRPRYLAGNHGMEAAWNKSLMRQAAAAVREWQRHLNELARHGDWPDGIEIENKKYSISVHYRYSRNPKRARAQLMRLLKSVRPKPRLVGGKFVINMTLPAAPHKGEAVKEILKRAKRPHTLFVGDDVTDEDAFALKHKGLAGVRVGRSPKSRAAFFIRDQREFEVLLRYLVKQFAR